MVSKIFVSLCVMVVICSALPSAPAGWSPWAIQPQAASATASQTNPWVPPWIASAAWFPKWSPCTMIGATCLDCNTKLACTKIGGIEKACSDPTKPYCNLGECSATPSEECAPVEDTPVEPAV